MSTADGYAVCEQGHRHWGKAGAAGLFISHTDDAGIQRHLLQHRAPGVHHGDTWGIPGGALGWGEEIETGAWREAVEELGPLPKGLLTRRVLTDDHGGWAYHTVVMESLIRFEAPGTGWETGEQGTGWFTPSEMAGLRLHPGFAHTLPLLLG
jgi:8-oxo-dGTP diphosphatase